MQLGKVRLLVSAIFLFPNKLRSISIRLVKLLKRKLELLKYFPKADPNLSKNNNSKLYQITSNKYQYNLIIQSLNNTLQHVINKPFNAIKSNNQISILTLQSTLQVRKLLQS